MTQVQEDETMGETEMEIYERQMEEASREVARREVDRKDGSGVKFPDDMEGRKKKADELYEKVSDLRDEAKKVETEAMELMRPIWSAENEYKHRIDLWHFWMILPSEERCKQCFYEGNSFENFRVHFPKEAEKLRPTLIAHEGGGGS